MCWGRDCRWSCAVISLHSGRGSGRGSGNEEAGIIVELNNNKVFTAEKSFSIEIKFSIRFNKLCKTFFCVKNIIKSFSILNSASSKAE